MGIIRHYWLFFLFEACSLPVGNDFSDTKDIGQAFWTELQTNYAYPSRIETCGLHENLYALTQNYTNEREMAFSLGSVLSSLHDGHLHLYTPWGILGNENYFSSFSSNSVDDNTAYFDTYAVLNSSIQWGTILNSSLAYLYIRNFEGNPDNFNVLDSLVVLWSNTFTGLIIDIRGNRGGRVEYSLQVASLFLASTRCIGKLRRCVDGRKGLYTSWANIIVQPAHLHTFQKPIVVLTDRFTYSAAEWFVLALANQSHVTFIGDTTGGGISLPVVRELPNGWLLSIPNTQFLSSDGHDIQFTGYPPNIAVVLSSDDRQNNRDILLKLAIRCLPSAK